MKLKLTDGSEIDLTQRQYAGEGYLHRFKHNITNKEVFLACTQEQYNLMGSVDGVKHNPSLNGHTWICSYQGTIKVDSETGILNENEYCIVGEKIFVSLKKPDGDVIEIDFPYTPNQDVLLWP